MVTPFLGKKNARSAILIILQETNKSDKKEAHLSSFYLAFSTISSAVPVLVAPLPFFHMRFCRIVRTAR